MGDKILVKTLFTIYDIGMADIRSFDLNLLIALDALLDEANVSRAADRLSLTQPTVSGMLARLRDGFGDPLLVRGRHGMVPTPRAIAVHPHVKGVLRDAAALLTPSVFDPSQAKMTVTLSVNDYMLSAVLAPFLRELRRSAPGIRLALVPLEIDGLAARMAEGQVDLAVTISEFAAPELRRLPLGRNRYIGVARPEHPIHKKPVTLDRFCSFDHVLVSPAGGGFQGPTDQALSQRGRHRHIALSVPTFGVLPEILALDDLIAVVPERLAITWQDRLTSFETPIEVEGFETVVVWHSRHQADPAHQWIRRSIADSVNSWQD